MRSLLFGKPNNEYCLIIPHDLRSKKFQDSIQETFGQQDYSLYPLACRDKKQVGRLFVVCKKANTPSMDFKEMVTDAYYHLKNFSVVHALPSSMSFLHRKNLDRSDQSPSLVAFEGYVHAVHARTVKICGLEVALNEQAVGVFRKQNLISYPLSSQELRTAKNWKNI
jgi:hypothetical protein